MAACNSNGNSRAYQIRGKSSMSFKRARHPGVRLHGLRVSFSFPSKCSSMSWNRCVCAAFPAIPCVLLGYDDGAMTKTAAQLHGALLLVHGTSDDNVHFQNSIQIIDALVKADKPLRLMIYPNKTHGIAGKAAQTHLFQLIEEHFEGKLKDTSSP